MDTNQWIQYHILNLGRMGSISDLNGLNWTSPPNLITPNCDVKLKECWMENFSSKVHFVPSWGSCGLKRVTFVGLFHSNSRSSICSKHRHLLNLVSVFYFKTWRSPIHLKSQSFADSLGHEHLFYSCSHHTWAIKWLNFMIRWLITYQKSVLNFPISQGH